MNGNIMLQTRGSLVNLLSKRALGYGEIFIATKQEINELKSTTIYDISGVTNPSADGVGTRITRIDPGDIFAGYNSQTKVYALGSSGALRWGGLYSGADYTAAKNQAAGNPNHIYMYVGNTSLKNQTTDITEKYVASASSEFLETINPGDLFFYSPKLDQTVVIHLNHSSDALTKINVDELVSSSMRTFLNATGFEGTLKDFLDGPARHYQYLDGKYGWTPITSLEGTTVGKTVSADPNKNVVGGFTITVAADAKFRDGEILYIPFKNGTNEYIVNGLGLSDTDKTCYEGDLFIAVPASGTDYAMDGNASGVSFVKVSLYGGLVRANRFATIARADEYATFLWANTTSASEGNDVDFQAAEDESGNAINGFREYIQRLFQTKVDIDPATRKIVSSQLPDFLLSAPKYMGTLETLYNEGADPGSVTAEDVFKKWAADKWANYDENEKATGTAGTIDTKDTTLRVGSYWIWQGDSLNISEYPNVFKIDEPEEGDDLLETTTETPATEGEGTVTTKNYSVGHVLNKGDWIIYDGTKFDIIDNTSRFVGITIAQTQLLEGLVDLEKYDRTGISYIEKDGSTVSGGTSNETTPYSRNGKEIQIKAENTVLFKVGGTVKTDDSHLPRISSTGLAHNTRIAFTGNGKTTGFNWEAGTGSTISPSFFANKYLDGTIPTDTDIDVEKTYNIKSLFGDGENNKVKVYIGDAVGTGATNKGATGFNFGDFQFTQAVDTIYDFSIAHEETPSVYLPNHSGTLATEEFVDYGFAVIKQVIDDMYLTIEEMVTAGHVDWLQTIVEVDDGNGGKKKKLFDSKIRQTYDAEKSLKVDLFTTMPTLKDDGSYTGGAFTTLSTYAKIDPSNLEKLNGLNAWEKPGKAGYPVDYDLPGVSGKLNPSEASESVENILPNHSGVLLNNNSVIDGGEW